MRQPTLAERGSEVKIEVDILFVASIDLEITTRCVRVFFFNGQVVELDFQQARALAQELSQAIDEVEAEACKKVGSS